MRSARASCSSSIRSGCRYFLGLVVMVWREMRFSTLISRWVPQAGQGREITRPYLFPRQGNPSESHSRHISAGPEWTIVPLERQVDTLRYLLAPIQTPYRYHPAVSEQPCHIGLMAPALLLITGCFPKGALTAVWDCQLDLVKGLASVGRHSAVTAALSAAEDLLKAGSCVTPRPFHCLLQAVRSARHSAGEGGFGSRLRKSFT